MTFFFMTYAAVLFSGNEKKKRKNFIECDKNKRAKDLFKSEILIYNN